jgi:hypothetical protein
VQAVARYQREIGHLVWAAPMDMMCEPAIIHGGTFNGQKFAGTGLSVPVHQRRTVANFTDLTSLWPQYSDGPCPFVPVLQGWTIGDYLHCADLYEQAGVRLADYPVTGVGSVCRRQGTARIGQLVLMLAPLRLHAFGVKTLGLQAFGHLLASADSLAWSADALHNPPLPGHEHSHCTNCLEYAAMWRDDLLDRLNWPRKGCAS